MHAYDAFEATQRVAQQLPKPTPVVVASCRCQTSAKTSSVDVHGEAVVPAAGYACQAKSVAFHFLAGEREGVASVEVLVPGPRRISVSFRIGADGIVVGLTTEGARQLLLHIKGKTCVQEFSEYLAAMVERAFTAGDLVLSKSAATLRNAASPIAVAHDLNVRARLLPG